MKKIWLCIPALFLMTLVLAQPHSGQNHRKHGEERRLSKGKDRTEALNLTPDQEKQFETLQLTQQKRMRDSRNQMEIKMAELKAQIQVNEPDQKVIDNLVEDINTLRGKLFKDQMTHVLEVRKILDDEQKLKFDRMTQRNLAKGFR